MARYNRRGYREYRGRRRGGSFILKVIVVLLALALLAGILFVVFLGEYVEYTDEGVRLNLPWHQERESDQPDDLQRVVIVTSAPSPEPSAAGEPPAPIGAVEVTAARILDGTAAQAAADAGGNALVVEMKGASGALAWQSAAELAETLGVNADSNDLAQAVAALAESGELYLVARIDCFRDAALARFETADAALMTRGGNVWYDSNGYCWVSPVSDAVTDYLAALCRELADMGFDEILLDSAGYPDFGEVNVLATDDKRPEDLTAPVAAFYEKVTEALAGSGAVLSIQASEQMTQLPGDQVYSGIVPSVLARYAGRVWLPEALSAGQYLALLEEAGLEAPEKRLVLENGTKESGSWYVTG